MAEEAKRKSAGALSRHQSSTGLYHIVFVPIFFLIFYLKGFGCSSMYASSLSTRLPDRRHDRVLSY